MLREKAKERGSGFWRKEVRKDFRENLYSIFVDNLNLVVDQEGLWVIFRCFGQVKDMYLSSKNRMCNRCYTFVRFASMSEASKVVEVVEMTIGMHIYGWPISSKLAAYGWSNQRSNSIHRLVNHSRDNEVKKEDYRGLSYQNIKHGYGSLC
ncbi:hypothetical protein Dsin_021315 [Dipteronia sinensis]|uniref:RRM domain-containing protein n=1 Tax=Dipteronia sinensis TaxID=43782 RepID=A0AAD9ZZX8_9ROSI|nr:hypothetical protein Dsin_021315 [Dipteronia sinensis]